MDSYRSDCATTTQNIQKVRAPFGGKQFPNPLIPSSSTVVLVLPVRTTQKMRLDRIIGASPGSYYATSTLGT
jgi:hypothetical protein